MVSTLMMGRCLSCKPDIGSPGVSCSSKIVKDLPYVRRFFFQRWQSPSGTASAVTDHVLVEKLLPAASDGMSIEIKKPGHELVAALADTHGFEPGEGSPLLFIEQGIEQQDGSF